MSIDTATPGSVRAADVQDDDEAEDVAQEEAAAAATGAVDESSMEMDDVAAAMEGEEGEGGEASPLNRSTASFKSQLDAVASPSESSFDGGEPCFVHACLFVCR